MSNNESLFNFDTLGLMKVMSLFQKRQEATDDYTDEGFRRLTDIELAETFRTSTLIQRIVKKYPMEAKTIGYDLIDSQGNIISDNNKELLLEAFKEASIYGRLYGKCFLHLILDDAGEEEPVNKNANITGYKIYYDIVREGDFFRVNENLIHYERIYIFIGNRTFIKDVNEYDMNYADSIIQGLYNSYADLKENMHNCKMILRNISYLTVGIDNLGVMSKSDEGRSMILDRLFTLNSTRSINRTIAYDKKSEAVGFISQTLSGVKDAIEEVKETFVSESDYPIEEIFDQSPKQKLGSGVQNQLIARYLWARRCRLWIINNWMENYILYYKRNRDMSKTKIEIPFKVDLTEEESANIQKLGAERIKQLIEAGVISVMEARTGYIGEKYTLNIELNNEQFRTSKLYEPRTKKEPPASVQEDSNSIPDDMFWQSLATVTMQDIDTIAEEILNVR